MKIKTFILTFLLMMMSGPIVFGQSRAAYPVGSYDDLVGAINNASTEDDGDNVVDIRLTADITGVTKTIGIKQGIVVSIDLYGKKLTSDPSKYLFTNNGTLIIKNTSDYADIDGYIETRGIINGENVPDTADKKAVLTIQNGIIRSNSTAGNLINNHKNGKVVVNGGKFYTENGDATTFVNKGEMTIGSNDPGADPVLVKSDNKYTFINHPGAKFTIQNTNIYDGREANKYYISSIAPNNGYYSPTEASSYGVTINEVGDKVIFVRAELVESGDGELFNGKPFASLKKAVEYATANNEGKVVNLLYNDIASEFITVDGKITIDGNNNTLTSTFNTADQGVFNIISPEDHKIIIKDLDIATTNKTERAINVKAKSDVELNNVTAEGFKYTINVPNSGAGCNITTNGGKYSGYAAVNITTEATFTAIGTEFVGINDVSEHPSNNYAVIAVNASNPKEVKINIDAASEITAEAKNNNRQSILTTACDDSEIIIAAKLNPVNGDIINGDVEGNKVVAFSEDYKDDLLAQGYAVSGEADENGMISVYGYAAATIDGVTYTSLKEAFKAVEDGQKITVIANDKDLAAAISATRFEYPVVGDENDAAKFFTITTKEGFQLETKGRFYFKNATVTVDNANINAVLAPSKDSEIILSGTNNIKTLNTDSNGKLSVAEGSNLTLGTLLANLNVANVKAVLKIKDAQVNAILTINNATLDEGSSLPTALDVVATGENTINAAINCGRFTIGKGAILNTNAEVIANKTVTIDGTLNVKEAGAFKQKEPWNYSLILNDGATINVAANSVASLGMAKVAAGTVNLNFNADVTFHSTTNAGTINLYMKEGTTFKTNEIAGTLEKTTDSNCKIFYENENNAYKAIRILNEGDVAIIEETGVGYATLQAAIDACVVGDNVITLLDNMTEDATVSQAENKNITIDGKGFNFSGTIYIEGNSRFTGAEELIIQNVNFTTEKDSHDFIASDFRLTDDESDDTVIRYAHNVTIENCNFEADGTGVVAMRFRQAYNINVKGGVFKNLHSVMWATAVSNGLTFDGITADCKNGISTDTSIDVTIKNSEINADVYAVRVKGSGDYNLTIDNSDFEAMIPVYVRNATGTHHDVIIAGKSTMTETNTENDYWCVIDAGDKYEETGDIADVVANDCQVVVDLSGVSDDSNLDYEGVYGHYGVAQIGNQRFQSLEAAAAAAKDKDVIELLWKEGQDPILMRATFVGNKTVTITGTANVIWDDGNDKTDDWFYVGRNGEGNGHVIFDNAHLTSESNSASSGFNVSGSKYGDDETNNGTIEIKDSNIELDYLINKNVMSLDNSTLTVKNGFSVGGRPAYDKDGYQDSESGEDATATMTLTNGSTVIVDNHNGMGLGYEAIGIMDIDTTSSFEARQDFLVTAKGTMNLAGTATIATDKTLTNNGTINLTNTNAKLYTTTTGLSIKTDLEGYKANYYAAAGEEPAHYRLLPNDEFLFVVKGTDENGDPTSNGYTTFPQAIDNAANGDTVIINTNGPIYLGSNKSENIVGKTVTVKMGKGFEYVKVDYYNRSLIVNNGAKVIFDGVELLPKNNNELNGREYGFVVNNGGTVEFVNGADITADYITVNEGGTININDSKVNVKGTFINDNEVNVEGISDIDMKTSLHENSPLGDGYFHMNGVTMNNSYVKGVKVIFNGENNNIGSSSTFTGSLLDIAKGAVVNVSDNATFTSNISGSVGISKIEGRLNLTSSESAAFNNLRLAGVIEVGEESNLKIGSTLYKNEGANIILNPTNATVNLQEGHLNIFKSSQWDYKVVYESGVYSLDQIEYNFMIVAHDEEGNQIYNADHYFLTFEEALANVKDGETIQLLRDPDGDDEKETVISYDGNEPGKAKSFYVTGEAQGYIMPLVTFKNVTVNIKGAKFSSRDIDARDNAIINITDGSVIYNEIYVKNPTVKAASNGEIIIENSTVYTKNVLVLGKINITGNSIVNASMATSVFETGRLNIGANVQFNTATLDFTGEEYSTASWAEPADNSYTGPAMVTVNGATFVAGQAYRSDGTREYDDVVRKYGICIGTEEPNYVSKKVKFDVANSTVQFYMPKNANPTGTYPCTNPIIGEYAEVNINASSFEVLSNTENHTVVLQNNGVVYVTGASDINASVEGAGWFYMNGVTMSNETQLLGAKVRFASGTNNLVGSTIDDGYFQVGIGAYEGVDENVDTDNGVIVNVSGNANVGASGATYAGWIGTGFYDTDAEKAAAMTEGVKYVLNINNSIAEFGYFHVSNDGELNVNGNADNKNEYDGSYYSFYAGDFIINGTAKFEATDVFARHTKVSCDNATETPGTLNIINTEYEADNHNGPASGIYFKVLNAGVVNAQGADTKLYLNEYTSIAKDAKFNVKENANVTSLGTITNDGTINVEAGTMTTGTAQITAIDNKSTGAITVAHGSTLKANTNIKNSGTLTVNGTLVADAQLNTTGTVAVNGNLNRTANAVNEINVNGGKMDVNGTVAANKINNNADFNVLAGGTVDVTYFQINADVDVTTPKYFYVENDVTGNATFKMDNVALTADSRLKNAKINFAGENTLTNANLAGSNVTVNSGAKLTVSNGSYNNNNNINVATLTNYGILTVDNYANVNVTNTVLNKANAEIKGTINGTGNIKDVGAGTLINDGKIEGNLEISVTYITNNKTIEVKKIVATDFNNASIVNVNGAHLESGSFLNDGDVYVNGESTVLITSPVSGDGNFNMSKVYLTKDNTRLHGAYIIFEDVNTASGPLEFSGKDPDDPTHDSGIEVNGTLNIYGKVTANYLGTGTGNVVLKETNSQLTANNLLDIYPEDPAFVETDVKGYHVVEGTDDQGLPNGVYILNSNDAYVAKVNGNYYETIQGAIFAANNGDKIEILQPTVQDVTVDRNVSFTAKEPVEVTGTLTVENVATFDTEFTFSEVVVIEAGAIVNVTKSLTTNKLNLTGSNARLNLTGEGAVLNLVGGNGSLIYGSSRIVLDNRTATFKTIYDGILDNVIPSEVLDDNYKVSYKNKDGQYQLVGKYVAQIGDKPYETLATALKEVPSNGEIKLLWEKGNDPIVMAGALSGKNAIITQAVGIDTGMVVDWSAGRLYVGRMTEHNNGDAKLTFKGVTFKSCNDGGTGENGIYVSTRVKNTEHYRGTLEIENSNIEISSIYSQFNTTINNSIVKFMASTGMNISGVNESYSPTGQPTTSTLVINNSDVTANKVLVANLGVGRVLVDVEIDEDNEFIPDTDAKSYVNVTSLDVLENGILSSSANIDGTITNAGGLIRLCGGIYETQPQADWFVENYGAFQLPNFKWEVRVTGGTQVSEFTQGWYWYSTYIDNVALSDVQKQLQNSASEIKSQFAFTNNFGSSWSTGGLNTFSPAEMYMLNITKPCALEFSGNFVDYSNTDIEIQPNWNWIGYPVSETVNVKVALENLQPAEFDVIKGQNGTAVYFMGAWMESNDEFNLVPGEGYMYKSNSEAAKTFVYNTIDTTNINDDETQTRATTVKRWNANTTQYPGNMTMIAMVSMDGEVVNTNYEVAAFANGELRGSARPIYVEALDSFILLMTISGNDVEELTFKYYDVNYGTEYVLNNRINYSTDAIVGSIDEPYMLNLDILNIDEPAVSEISIYPNPTTTNVEINLNAKYDTVEVFNALGVKVAEYSNVDSIDALETAGIYVIRITNDDNVHNCRLVVK